MLRSNHGMCFNWNALIATAETTNKHSLQIKTALFTNLWYFLPLIEGSVCMLVLSKARKQASSLKLIKHARTCSNDRLHSNASCSERSILQDTLHVQ